MLWLRFNPYRAMRGASYSQAATNLATFGLYNNTRGAELLVLWIASCIFGGDIISGLHQGLAGTVQTNTTPFMPSQAPTAGQVTFQDTASVISYDLAPVFQNNLAPHMNPIVPWIVLEPGWSYLFQDQKTGQTDSMSFIWQSVHREDLSGMPCSVCTPWLMVTATG